MPTVFSPLHQWPAAPYIERWSYFTRRFRSDNDTEQRALLRIIPTRQDRFTVAAVEAREAGLLDALSFGQTTPWAVPFWPHVTPLLADAAPGADVVLQVDRTDRDFAVGGSAVLYLDEHTHELVTLNAVGAGTVTAAAVVGSWPANRTVVLPARLARFTGARETDRAGVGAAQLAVTFDYEHGTDPGVATPGAPPIFAVEQFGREPTRDTLEPSVDRLDNRTYTFADYPRGPTPIGRRTSLPLWLETPAAVQALRTWYFSVKGALTAFWLPTWQMDLEPVADVVSGVAALTIRSIGYTERLFPHEARRHLAFVPPAGAITHQRVTAAVNNGDGTETLTLSGSSGAPIYPGAGAGLVSFLLYVRLAEDPFEIRWLEPGHATAALDVVELPRQVPVVV